MKEQYKITGQVEEVYSHVFLGPFEKSKQLTKNSHRKATNLIVVIFVRAHFHIEVQNCLLTRHAPRCQCFLLST